MAYKLPAFLTVSILFVLASLLMLPLKDYFGFKQKTDTSTPAINTLSQVSPQESSHSPTAAASKSADTDSRESVLARTTESLKKTQIDGRLNTDAQGRFIADRDALRLFDYFLLAKGEIGLSEAIEHIRAYIDSNLAPPADQQAHRFLDQYLAFQDAAKQQHMLTEAPDIHDINLSQLSNVHNIEAQYAQLQALRAEFFDTELSARLFPLEQEQLSIQQLKIYLDPQLSASEKKRAIQKLLASQPQAAQEQTGQYQQAAQTVAAMQQSGADTQQIWDYREQQWGAEAADRLAALDEQRNAWAERIQDFKQQKDLIEHNAVLTPAQKEESIQALLNHNFNTREQLRIDAALQLDAMPQQP